MAQKRKRTFWTKEYDAERAAIKRAKAAGFDSVAAHRVAIDARKKERGLARQRQAEINKGKALAAATLPPPQTTMARSVHDYSVSISRDGVITREALPPVTTAQALPEPTPTPEPVPAAAAARPFRKWNLQQQKWEIVPGPAGEKLRALAAGKREPTNLFYNGPPGFQRGGYDPVTLGGAVRLFEQEARQRQRDDRDDERIW